MTTIAMLHYYYYCQHHSSNSISDNTIDYQMVVVTDYCQHHSSNSISYLCSIGQSYLMHPLLSTRIIRTIDNKKKKEVSIIIMNYNINIVVIEFKGVIL